MLPSIKRSRPLQKMLKHLTSCFRWLWNWPAPVPSHPMVGVSYQINGKIAPLKGRRKEQFKTFRVDRFALSYSLAHDKNFSHLHSHFKTFSKKDKTFCIRSYRDENHCKTSFQNTFWNTIHKHIFEPLFETKLCIRSYRDENHYKEIFQNTFKAHITSTLSNESKWSKWVTKSPWKTMDEKGANTFPFHNLPPEPEK